MPFPLYGSGGRMRRMRAATSPTSSLSAPDTVIAFFSTAKVMPDGASQRTGWENPTANWRLGPSIIARYPTPSISSFLENPFATPSTMAARSARVSPQYAGVLRLPLMGATFITAPSTATKTSGRTVRVRVPLGPVTVTVRPYTWTLTPAGSGIGCFPMRLIYTRHEYTNGAPMTPIFVTLVAYSY